MNTEWSLIPLVALLALIVIFFKSNKVKKWVISNLVWFAIVIFVTGVILYWIGFNEKGCENNIVALLLRASLSSMEMFVLYSDLIEVGKDWHDCGWYMTIFAITHFLAVLISAIFIVRMFGFRLLSWFKLQMWRWWGVKELHVFFGVNENSMLVAKSIYEQNYNQNKTEAKEKKIKKTSRIIFVNTPSDTHSRAFRFSFSRFFLSSNDDVEKYYAEIEDIDALMTNASRSFKNCIIDDKNNEPIFRLLGIPSCGKLIEMTLACGKQVKLYFLSDDEDDNKYAIMRLKGHQIMDSDNLKCYCHARNNAVNRQLLVSDKKMLGRLHIVDTSTLTIQELKKNEMHHPVNYVNINKDATVDEFAGMVIGFGETGRDAFCFLWEYASFVKSVENENVIETPKTFYLVDKDLSRHQADFMIGTPALEDEQTIVALESNATINWCEMSTHNIAFNRLLREVIDRLNYVVIAVGNEDEAITIMQKVCQVSSQYRQNPLKLGLYVSVRNKEKKEIIEIIYKGTDSNVIIHSIGIKQDIFKLELLDNDDIEKKAKVFYFHYTLLEKREVEKDIKEYERIKCLKVDGCWNDRRKKEMEHNNIIKLEYQEEQDRSNAYHIYTKRTLASFPCTRNRLDCLADEKLMKVLSFCEHLRWNAKMILMGFVYRETKNLSKREHDCMLSCNKLKNGPKYDTIKYDAATVNLSLDEELKPIK